MSIVQRGVVAWFDQRKGFGFIVGDDGANVFVHYSAISSVGRRVLMPGETVEFGTVTLHFGDRVQVKAVAVNRLKGDGDEVSAQGKRRLIRGRFDDSQTTSVRRSG